MHILLGALGLLSAAAFWIYRMKAASDAARELADVADNLSKLPRRMAFRRKTGRGGLRLVDDPREAAAVLLVEMERCATDGAGAREAIETEIAQAFGFDAEEAEALAAQAGWLLREAPPSHAVAERMARLIHRSAGPDALDDLDRMLAVVADVGGAPSADQADLLAEYRRQVSVLAR